LTNIAGIDGAIFGQCFGFKLQVTQSTMDRLLLNGDALQKLQKFGVFPNCLDSMQQAIPLKITKLDLRVREENELRLAEIMAMMDCRLGLRLRSVMDSKKFIWHHAMMDHVRTRNGLKRNLFDLVKQEDRKITEYVGY
jgi:hypothetical protein